MINFKASEDLSPHHQFQTFIDIFTDTVNFHVPYRRTTKKEKKLKEKSWLPKIYLNQLNKKTKCIKNFLIIQIVHYILNTKNIVTLSIEH